MRLVGSTPGLEPNTMPVRARLRTTLAIAASGFAAVVVGTPSLAQQPVPAYDSHRDFVTMLGPTPTFLAEPHSNMDGPIPVSIHTGDWAYLFEYYNIGADCRPLSFIVDITTPAAHGHLSTTQASAVLSPGLKRALGGSSGRKDPRASCPQGEYPASLVRYTPNPGYVGPDYAVVEVHDHSYTEEARFSLRVLP
jgi:hypothetical protein